MPTLNSHTHCQAAPVNAQTQTWQRVCLSQRSTKTTGKPANEKEARLPNIGFAKWLMKCFYDCFVQNSSSVLQLYICAENPPFRKAKNR